MHRFERIGYRNRVISECLVGGENIIAPWGVEFADSSAFYSLEDGFGYRYQVLTDDVQEGPEGRTVRQTLRMHEGLVALELREWLESPRCIRRTVSLECLEDTTLMDFVLRFRFRSDAFQFGSIAGRYLPYRNTRVYHQYPVSTAAVSNQDYSVQVSVLERIVPDSMAPYMYLRDGDGHWVLHVRMLPRKWEREVIKLCSRWFQTRPLPDWVTRPILKVPGIRNAIWYRGERRPYRNRLVRVFSPNAYPMPRLKRGERLLWDTACAIGPRIDTDSLLKDDVAHVWPKDSAK